ncbi:MAG: chromosomal replication initiator protein DnaA [Puniceicoccales bacterium]|jgi:chromosomal replication initiator protein|nr:chromosomal replication initiator protein DnaA [Puniceicoccales bacterium]
MNFLEENKAIWNAARNELRAAVPDSAFSTWFAGITCTGGDDARVDLSAPSAFVELWVSRNYHDLLERNLTLAAGRRMTYRLTAPEEVPQPEPPPVTRAEPEPQRPAPLPTSIKSDNTFENFVRGPENEMALAAALAVSKDPGRVYNPLFIYGGPGLGKTHLLHAIAQAVLANSPRTRLLYITCEAFTNHYIRTVADGSWTDFRKHYRQTDVLLLDDVQFLAERERTQEEFFHTFNELHNDLRQIVLTCDRPPEELRTLEDRLKSRFKWGLITDVGTPSLETRTAILRKKAAAAGMTLPPEVETFLAERITVDVRNLEGAVLRLRAHLEATGAAPSALTVEHVARLLAPLLTEEARSKLTPEVVQREVAAHYRIPVSDMTSKKRTADVAFARQVAMYLCGKLTDMSLTAIAAAFGKSDHGTAIHARRTVEARCDTEEHTRSEIQFLTEKITRLRR